MAWEKSLRLNPANPRYQLATRDVRHRSARGSWRKLANDEIRQTVLAGNLVPYCHRRPRRRGGEAPLHGRLTWTSWVVPGVRTQMECAWLTLWPPSVLTALYLVVS